MSDAVSLEDLLEKTSRTFALSIPMLPQPTRRHAGIAYLLFRIADTLEDAAHWSRDARLAALDVFAGWLLAPGGEPAVARRWLTESPVSHAGYLELLRDSPGVMEAYWSMPEAPRAIVQRELRRTVSGMSAFVRRADARGRLALSSRRELRDYCYAVAGIVGEMLTELFLVDATAIAPVASRLRRRARFFGEALQLVNILKDVRSDTAEGRAYLPDGFDRAGVIALARRDLEIASSYVATLQRAGAPEGYVAFTGSPAVLARASLRVIEAGPPDAKLSRAEVAALMERMFEDLRSGRPLL